MRPYPIINDYKETHNSDNLKTKIYLNVLNSNLAQNMDVGVFHLLKRISFIT